MEKSRKQMKERKNRAKKIRGVKKVCSFSLIRLVCLVLVPVWSAVVSLRSFGKLDSF